MFENNNQPTYLKELQWLANYYSSHGHTAQAKEILDSLSKMLKTQTATWTLPASAVLNLG